MVRPEGTYTDRKRENDIETIDIEWGITLTPGGRGRAR